MEQGRLRAGNGNAARRAVKAREGTRDERGRPGHLYSPSGCSVQCDAACRPAVALTWADTRPPWTMRQLQQIRDETDPQGRRRGPQVPHGTLTRWLEGCDCDRCREAQNDAARVRGRARAQKRLPAELRQQLLAAIYAGKPFKTAIRDFGLTSNQVWGLTKTDEDWSAALEATLTATRRDDLQHGTSAAYAHGCVCSECRAHQRIRMARKH